MTRITSTPTINITVNNLLDENDVTVGASCVISATYYEGFAGSITLNDVNDMAALRHEIDRFLEAHNPELLPASLFSDDEPMNISAVKGWLGDLKPAEEYVEGETYVVTGNEILNALADTCDLELNEIAYAMKRLGFKFWRVNHRYGWLVSGNPF
ncbi:MAG: hypothetical protein ACI31C_06965 [Muribaculaceae bacterium]